MTTNEKYEETATSGGDLRPLEVPGDLASALAEVPGALEAFNALPLSKRKAHVTSIEASQADDSRHRRIAAVLATLAT